MSFLTAIEMKTMDMPNKSSKYRISPMTIRKANFSLIKSGISDLSKNAFQGDISLQYQTKRGTVKKVFTNDDIKSAYKKALAVYAERV